MSDDLSRFLRKLEGVLEREARLADQMAELKALREAVEKAEAAANKPPRSIAHHPAEHLPTENLPDNLPKNPPSEKRRQPRRKQSIPAD
jgi:hypothetical protein